MTASSRARRVLRALNFDAHEVETFIRDHGAERILEIVHFDQTGAFRTGTHGADARLDNERALLEHLQRVAGVTHKPASWAYANAADLLLKHGELMYPQAYDVQPYELGEMSYCFRNARDAAKRWPRKLTYVEGYALSRLGVPMHHAWLVDQQNRAWDVTWQWSVRDENHHPAEGVLLGVRVPLAVLDAHWSTCGSAALLDDNYHRFPALRVAYSDWETELVHMLERLRVEHCAGELRNGNAIMQRDGSIKHLDGA